MLPIRCRSRARRDAGRVAVAPLIDAVYPLDEGVAAFARAALPGTFKVLIETGS